MKKNQLALIFLTLITMLAVWYFKSPSAQDGPNDPTIIVTNTKNQVLASMVSKTAASVEKDELSALFELEALLEVKVMNLGYQDAFVHSTTSGIEVIVITNEASASAALDIINVINETFTGSESIVVNFKTNEELKQA